MTVQEMSFYNLQNYIKMNIFQFSWYPIKSGAATGIVNVLAKNRLEAIIVFEKVWGEYFRPVLIDELLEDGILMIENLNLKYSKAYLEDIVIHLTQEVENIVENIDVSDFNLYQRIVTNKLTFPEVHQDLYLVALLNEESGEISKLFRKQIEKSEAINREDLKLELGDVLWTLVALAKTHGILMSEVIEGNILKLSERNLL